MRIRLVVALVAAGILAVQGSPPPANAALTPAIAAIAAGFHHSCALTAGGGVKCWGDNSLGQLGNGTTTSSPLPVGVVGLASGVKAIAAGQNTTCALTIGGGVKCWGANYTGQLGVGTAISSSTPLDVLGMSSGIVAIAPGARHTCALTSAGGVKCWGANGDGQLGDGTTTGSLFPIDVPTLTAGVTAIAVNNDDTCALTNAGGVKCWGNNVVGALGNGTTTDRFVPTDVVGLAGGVAAISVGLGYTCALTGGGGVKCWGAANARIGNATPIDSVIPADMSGLASGVTAISVGGNACVLTMSGGVKCWGADDLGQLGNGPGDGLSLVPVDVAGLASGVRAIATGDIHACAITGDGGVRCWGDNTYGELGNGTTAVTTTPVAVDLATRQSVILRTSKAAGTVLGAV